MKGPGPQERPSLESAAKPYLLSAFSLAVWDAFLAKVRSSRGVQAPDDRRVRRAPSSPISGKNSLLFIRQRVRTLCADIGKEWNIIPFEWPFCLLYRKSFLLYGAADALLAGLSRSRQRDGGARRFRGGCAQQAAAVAGCRRQCALVFLKRRRRRGSAAREPADGSARAVLCGSVAGGLF